MPSFWVEEVAQQKECFGLRSSDWQRENSLRD